jgi:hypothetical protein
MVCSLVIHRNQRMPNFKRVCSSHESLWDSSVCKYLAISISYFFTYRHWRRRVMSYTLSYLSVTIRL